MTILYTGPTAEDLDRTFLDTAQVNLFHGSFDSTPSDTITLAKALEAIRTGAYQQPVERLRRLLDRKGKGAYDTAKAKLDAVTFCGTFTPTRAKANLAQHTAIVHGDLDHLADLQAAKAILCADRYTAYGFASPSGTGLKVGVRVKPVENDDQYKHAWQAVADYHQQHYGIVWDKSGKDVSRLCYMSWDPECYVNPDASLFPVPGMVVPPPRPQTPRPTIAPLPTDRRQWHAQQALATAVKSIDASTSGTRHQARTKAAYLLGGYVAGGILDEAEAYAALEAVVARNTDDVPRSMQTIADCLQAGMEAPFNLEDLEAQRHQWLQEHRAMSQQPHRLHSPPPADQDTHQRQNMMTPREALPAGDPAADLGTVSPCTHTANAKRLGRDYPDRLRYVVGRGWILWTGQYWRTDPTADGAVATGFVSGLAGDIAREAATLLDQAANEQERTRRDALMTLAEARLKWAVQSENERGIAAALKLAKRALLIEHSAVDTNPWLFNCQNGTLDLRTGTLLTHNPADLITHIAPVTFDPAALCPTWERFLSEVFAGDMAMVRFLQRAIGWALTGVVEEKALLFLYGPKGDNGKTTLVEAIRDFLGDCGEASAGYARKVDVSTFMKGKNTDDNQRKVAVRAGPRFVCTSEVSAEHRLNEQLLKDITGGDTIEGRYLYHEPFNFKPTFKPWMYGNHKPDIRGTDDPLWNRIKLVEFEVSFTDRKDLKLPDKLRAELSGMLNWALEGCRAWQKDGLQTPEKVKVATQTYRLEQDIIAQFITDCCVKLKDAYTPATRLYHTYSAWCAANGHDAQSQKRFGAYLTGHDFQSDGNQTGRGILRKGIGLQAPPDDDDASATPSTSKVSTAQPQQRSHEPDKSSNLANLANLKTYKPRIEGSLRGFSGLKISKVSTESGEPPDTRVDTHDASANPSPSKVSTVPLATPAGAVCPQCGCSELMRGTTYHKCPLCAWQDTPRTGDAHGPTND